METEKEYFVEDKKSGKGKRGKYLEKEKKYHLRRRRKDAEGKGGKYLEFFLEEKEANIMETLHWRGKNYCGRVDGRTGRRLTKKSSRI